MSASPPPVIAPMMDDHSDILASVGRVGCAVQQVGYDSTATLLADNDRKFIETDNRASRNADHINAHMDRLGFNEETRDIYQTGQVLGSQRHGFDRLDNAVARTDRDVLRTGYDTTSTLLADNDRKFIELDNRAHRNNHFTNDHISQADFASERRGRDHTQHVLSDMHRGHDHILGDLHRDTARVVEDVHRGGDYTNANVNRNVDYINANVNRNTDVTQGLVRDTTDRVLDTMGIRHMDLSNQANRNTDGVRDMVRDTTTNLASDVHGEARYLSTEGNRNADVIRENLRDNKGSFVDTVHTEATNLNSAVNRNADNINDNVRDTKSSVLDNLRNETSSLNGLLYQTTSGLQGAIQDTKSQIVTDIRSESNGISDTIQQTGTRLHEIINNSRTQTLSDIANATSRLNEGINRVGEQGLEATERNGRDNLMEIGRVGAAASVQVERVGAAGIQATRDAKQELFNSMTDGFRDTSSHLNNHTMEAMREYADLRTELEKIKGGSAKNHGEYVEALGHSSEHLRDHMELYSRDALHYATDNARDARARLNFVNDRFADRFTHAGDFAREEERRSGYRAGEFFQRTDHNALGVERRAIERTGEFFQRDQAKMDSILLQGATNTAKLELQAANNTAAIQLEALRNKCALESKIEECCCQVKEKIDGTEAARLRDELAEANMRKLIAESRSRRD